MSASTEVVGKKLFGSKIICNKQVTVIVTKMQQVSSILLANDRPKQSLIISKTFLRVHENFI